LPQLKKVIEYSNARGESVTLNYQLTLDDYLEATRFHSKSKPIEYYGMQFLGWFGLIVGVFLLAVGTVKDLTGYVVGALSLLGGAYIVLAFTVLRKYLHERRLKRFPSFLLPIVLKVSATQLSFQTAEEGTQFGWKKYKKSLEAENLFLLYRSDKAFQLVPKRAFANEADLEQFRAWVSGIGQKDAPPSAPIPQP